MSTATTLRVIRAASRAKVPTLIWGSPGGGKSETLEGLAALEGVPCEVVIGSQREPSDFNGLPIREPDETGKMVTTFSPPQWAQRLATAGEGMVFLDELSTSPPSVQAAQLRVIKDFWVGDVKLPDDVYIVAAANEAEEAADGWELAPPTANRFMHLPWRVSTEDWITGMTIGFDKLMGTYNLDVVDADDARLRDKRVLVASFIQARPTHFHAVPDDSSKAGKAWPSPRTWDYLSKVLAYLRDDDHEAVLAASTGLVGEAAALEFLTWVEHYDLPDPAKVLDDPATYDWSDADQRDDRTFAVLAGVMAYTAAAEGTELVERWDKVWDVFCAAGDAGKPDLAAAFIGPLMNIRPPKGRIPSHALKPFSRALRDAGIMPDKQGA
jgi:hypothetical protein